MQHSTKKHFDAIGYYFLALFVLMIIGFFKTYFGTFPGYVASVKSASVVHFHAGVSILWVVLLVVQPLLIRYRKYAAHRVLGRLTYVLVPLIIISLAALIYTKYQEGRMWEWSAFDVLLNFYFQILHTVFFLVFYTLALINRRNFALHGGYMIATGLIFINPIMRRVFTNAFGTSFTLAETIAILLTDTAIVALLFYAKKRSLNYKFYYLILALFMLYHLPMLALIHIFYPGM
jgi:hypothetical protein